MGVHILLADPRNLIGKDLRELLGTFPIVEHIDEVATDEELKVHLSSCPIDLAIVHQSFMSNMDELSKKYFLIVATQGDTDIALTALDQGGRSSAGYADYAERCCARHSGTR